MTETAIVEAKFKHAFDLVDYVQLFLYGLLIDPLQQKDRILVNLRTGETIRFRFHPDTHDVLLATISHALPFPYKFTNQTN